MNVTWITQAGLVFENERLTVMVDPYLSNSVAVAVYEVLRQYDFEAHL